MRKNFVSELHEESLQLGKCIGLDSLIEIS